MPCPVHLVSAVRERRIKAWFSLRHKHKHKNICSESGPEWIIAVLSASYLLNTEKPHGGSITNNRVYQYLWKLSLGVIRLPQLNKSFIVVVWTKMRRCGSCAHLRNLSKGIASSEHTLTVGFTRRYIGQLRWGKSSVATTAAF